jgi:hypothetical protein
MRLGDSNVPGASGSLSSAKGKGLQTNFGVGTRKSDAPASAIAASVAAAASSLRSGGELVIADERRRSAMPTFESEGSSPRSVKDSSGPAGALPSDDASDVQSHWNATGAGVTEAQQLFLAEGTSFLRENYILIFICVLVLAFDVLTVLWMVDMVIDNDRGAGSARPQDGPPDGASSFREGIFD